MHVILQVHMSYGMPTMMYVELCNFWQVWDCAILSQLFKFTLQTWNTQARKLFNCTPIHHTTPFKKTKQSHCASQRNIVKMAETIHELNVRKVRDASDTSWHHIFIHCTSSFPAFKDDSMTLAHGMVIDLCSRQSSASRYLIIEGPCSPISPKPLREYLPKSVQLKTNQSYKPLSIL